MKVQEYKKLRTNANGPIEYQCFAAGDFQEYFANRADRTANSSPPTMTEPPKKKRKYPSKEQRKV